MHFIKQFFSYLYYRAKDDMKTIFDLTKFYREKANLTLLSNKILSLREKMWLFLDEPRSSVHAKVGSKPSQLDNFSKNMILSLKFLYAYFVLKFKISFIILRKLRRQLVTRSYLFS